VCDQLDQSHHVTVRRCPNHYTTTYRHQKVKNVLEYNAGISNFPITFLNDLKFTDVKHINFKITLKPFEKFQDEEMSWKRPVVLHQHWTHGLLQNLQQISTKR